jgi:hypothetical protein
MNNVKKSHLHHIFLYPFLQKYFKSFFFCVCEKVHSINILFFYPKNYNHELSEEKPFTESLENY